MAMRVTICFGGSTFNPDKIDVDALKNIAKALSNAKERNHEILVTVGGGSIAKKYIKIGEDFGASKNELDKIGIKITRLNARLLIAALGDDAASDPPKNFDKAIRNMLRNKIPVMGGTTPGHTTDAVAAKLAQNSNSELLIFFTDVDGVYTADPKKNKEAEKIDEMTTSDLADLMSKMEFEPGMTAIIDPLATEILQQSNIRALVLGKDEISRLSQVIEGSRHSGTEIVPGSKGKK